MNSNNIIMIIINNYNNSTKLLVVDLDQTELMQDLQSQ